MKPKILGFCLFAFFPGLLFAQTTLRLGVWQAQGRESWLLPQVRDQWVDGFPDGIQRASILRDSTQSYLFPLGLSHVFAKSNFDWILTGNYFHRSLAMDFSSFDSRGTLTQTKASQGYDSDLEMDLGIRKTLFSEKLSATVRLGARTNVSEFTVQEVNLGANTALTTLQSAHTNWNLSLYPAISLEWKAMPRFSPWLEVMLPSSLQTGSWESESIRGGSYTNRLYWESSRLSGIYQRELTRFSIGGNLVLTEAVLLNFGFREERVALKVPDLDSRPWRVADGGTFGNFSAEPALQFGLWETLFDQVQYNQRTQTSWRGIFLGVDLKFN